MAYHTIGLGRSITHGIVNAIYSNVIQFSAPISSGNSRAPLLDVYGEVVGIVTSAAMPKKGASAFVQNMNYAIPVTSVPLLMRPRP
jgi:S1-C subfamily serine protease